MIGEETWEESRQDVLSTAFENTQSLVTSCLTSASAENFLHRDDHIIIRSTNLTLEEQDVYLKVVYDVDGVVLGLSSLEAINFQVRFLQFPHEIGQLKVVYPLLKKHLPLQDFTIHSHKVLRHARGFSLFYEHGWDCYISLIPSKTYRPETIDDCIILKQSFCYFQRLVECIKKALVFISLGGKCIQTIKKNAISKLRRLHLLPDDQHIIIKLVNDCIVECGAPSGFHPFIFTYRFGERKKGTFYMNDFRKDFVYDQTVHIAATFSSEANIGYLWSRQGIQRIIGDRGILSPCLSFRETANYQSNLDGRLIELKKCVRDIVDLEGRIRFVQFYGDSPHICPNGRPHPVSGSIVTCGLLHHKSLEAIERQAVEYISVCKDNVCSMGNDLKCRIEFVLAPSNFVETINPTKMFKIKNISLLLSNEALLVPFDLTSNSLCTVLKGVGLHLVETLEQLFADGKCLGSYDKSWKAFQYELAMEKLLWGKPLCNFNSVLSINLGPGVSNPSRSKTDWLGFLALDQHSVACTAEEPPPPKIWVRSEKVVNEIETLFGFSDFLKSSNAVLGKKALTVILTDLYQSTTILSKERVGEFLGKMKSSQSPSFCVCVGAIRIEDLTNMLATGRNVKQRSCTRRMFQILTLSGKSLKNILFAGILESKLHFFPVLKAYDSSRNSGLYWDGIRVWNITADETTDFISDVACQSASQVILNQLGERNLIYESKLSPLKNRPGFMFPWIKPILIKLSECELSKTDSDTILLFLTCIGLLQQNWFINFYELRNLEKSIPLSQITMRGMEIQSRKLLGSVTCTKIWRLHESIPIKIQINEKKQNTSEAEMMIDEKDLYDSRDVLRPIQEVGNNDIIQEDVIFAETRHVSVCCHSKWKAQELDILHTVATELSLSSRQKYDLYLTLCFKEGVPDRSFGSFRKKLSRI